MEHGRVQRPGGWRWQLRRLHWLRRVRRPRGGELEELVAGAVTMEAVEETALAATDAEARERATRVVVVREALVRAAMVAKVREAAERAATAVETRATVVKVATAVEARATAAEARVKAATAARVAVVVDWGLAEGQCTKWECRRCRTLGPGG